MKDFQSYTPEKYGTDAFREAIHELAEQLGPNTAMLVKASHSMHFGWIVEELRRNYD